ncbi:nuclear factor of activated T-cells 5 isoform X1 [Folsomia candida]|uniref:nuclear factor of activated T-cells 5 isoform X1 n=1 Tax=Folsomia candida TaxID=158441 RepID=UPI000B8FF426|nr:nuclear factor of activated T-cells 5 isoform X1 [Folsomia candida]
MKLRRPITNFKSAAQQKTKPAFWNFDSSSNFGSEDARFLELKAYYSRPSGKGRFGKRPLSFAVDQNGYSNDSTSNSSDSGIDFNSYESQLSWCSEDAHLGRSSSISNLSSASNSLPPQFVNPYAKKELVLKTETKLEPINNLGNEGSIVNLLDISNTARLLMPEKAQIVPQSMRMSPDSSDQVVNMVTQSPLLGLGSHSPNSNSPTSSTLSPPIKRPRFSYLPQPNCGKGTGLKLRNQNQANRGSIGKRLPPGTTPTLSSALSSVSRDGRVQLQIVSQPEEQHRARYQTEGSRGAIKDRKGNGFPTVKLVGYDKPATLQIFIGTDQGKLSPHMFYQACKVTGKSSTPCIEKKVEGTIVIEIEFEPSKDMVISCDCVGILKERNVDVEQRFPFHHAAQSRKKSTKCRMVYRTTIINAQGMEETLQLSSSPILCTQPPGHPEICKQSTQESAAKGGNELFVIGKNFLKDTRIYFQEEDSDERILWEVMSEPLKDYLQQNHLICVIPPYKNQHITSPLECKVTIVSGGKQSEPHRFTYLPNMPATARYGNLTSSAVPSNQSNSVLGQDPMGQPISHNQMPMSINIQNVGSLGTTTNEDCSSLSHPLSQVDVSQASLPIPTSPTRTTVPTSSFRESIHSAQAAQERQVVNELQCILDQSVSQHRTEQNSVSEMHNLISIKSEIMQQDFSSINQQQQHAMSMSATVPLDLQFPSAVTVESSTSTNSNMVQSQMSFSGQQQGVNTASQFSPTTTSLSCITPTTAIPMLTRQGSVELVNVEHQILSELLPGQVTMTSVPQTNSNSAITVTCQSLGSSMSVASNDMCQVSDIIKMETQSSPIGPQLNVIPLNTVASVASSQPPSAVPTGLAPQTGYMVGGGNGDFQVHSGSIANALTQMSENELINYINPSCFEQPML